MTTVRFALVGVCYISEERARLSGPPHQEGRNHNTTASNHTTSTSGTNHYSTCHCHTTLLHIGNIYHETTPTVNIN